MRFGGPPLRYTQNTRCNPSAIRAAGGSRRGRSRPREGTNRTTRAAGFFGSTRAFGAVLERSASPRRCIVRVPVPRLALAEAALTPTATIVLPVHNRERTLRPEVLRILDLAEIMHRRVVVAIVDDGSRDGTYEAACELARQFPQVRALRQPHQCGLGAALLSAEAR